jgi:putative redox protein
MAKDTLRSVQIERTAAGQYTVRSVRGDTISVGSGAEGSFTPVELLLAAIGCCAAIDVDVITSRRAEPDEFTIVVTGDKIRDQAGGNRMENLAASFTVRFPEGEAGDAAREVLPQAVRTSHDRLCTVSRTVELGTPVSVSVTA